jgi:hypothetical protein
LQTLGVAKIKHNIKPRDIGGQANLFWLMATSLKQATVATKTVPDDDEVT